MRWFVTSDIHSYFSEFKQALDRSGFDINNKEHILIVCGDIFDRGPEPLKVYNFLKSIPRERRILIRGNHEILLQDLVERGYALSHDHHNRTDDTVYRLAGKWGINRYDKYINERLLDSLGVGATVDDYAKLSKKINERSQQRWQEALKSDKLKEVIEWIKSDEWVEYYELDKYIFVHSFIPLKAEDDLPPRFSRGRVFKYYKDWRDLATEEEWYSAKWGCPFQSMREGHFKEEIKNGKVLVCGHWHTSDFFQKLKGIKEERYDIYYSKNLIGLDGCTAYSGVCNVMIIDENFKCYQNGKELVEIKSEFPKNKEISFN